jgi:hypothetical protein
VKLKATSWPWKQLMGGLKIDLEHPKPHHGPLTINWYLQNSYEGEMGSYMPTRRCFTKVSSIRSSWWTHPNFVTGWLYLSITNPRPSYTFLYQNTFNHNFLVLQLLFWHYCGLCNCWWQLVASFLHSSVPLELLDLYYLRYTHTIANTSKIWGSPTRRLQSQESVHLRHVYLIS